MRKILSIVACLFMLSAPSVMAQDVCESDFTCDGDVDADDVSSFLADFGRSIWCAAGFLCSSPCSNENPCPTCEVGNWCVYP